jgi:hypothetical protein
MFSCHCRKWALISIVRLVGLLLLFATALVALYDCGMTAEPGGAGGSSEMRSIEETSNEPEPTLMGGGSKPPNSTLSYGAERVSGALGTYCWTNGCVDSVGIVANTDELTVPVGSTMTFAYGGRKLDSADVAAYRIGPRNQPEEMGRSILLIPAGKGTELPARQSGNQAQITAELPVDRYVVDVFVTMPQGDASYGFLIAVE